MEHEFSDYTSYLGAAFALNLMFSLWDNLHLRFISKLEDHHEMLIQRMHATFADDPNEHEKQIENSKKTLVRRKDTYELKCSKYIQRGKAWCLVFATLIGLSFFVFAGYESVSSLCKCLIFITPGPPIVAAACLFVSYRRLKKESKKLVDSTIELTGKPSSDPESQESIKTEWKIEKRQS